MSLIAQQCLGIALVVHPVTVYALHMDRRPTEKAILNEAAHFGSCMTELMVMTNSEFNAFRLGQRNQFRGLIGGNSKRFFDKRAAPLFDT